MYLMDWIGPFQSQDSETGSISSTPKVHISRNLEFKVGPRPRHSDKGVLISILATVPNTCLCLWVFASECSLSLSLCLFLFSFGVCCNSVPLPLPPYLNGLYFSVCCLPSCVSLGHMCGCVSLFVSEVYVFFFLFFSLVFVTLCLQCQVFIINCQSGRGGGVGRL